MKKLALSIALTFVFALTLTSFHKGNKAQKQDRQVIKVQKTTNLGYDYGDEDFSLLPFPPKKKEGDS